MSKFTKKLKQIISFFTRESENLTEAKFKLDSYLSSELDNKVLKISVEKLYQWFAFEKNIKLTESEMNKLIQFIPMICNQRKVRLSVSLDVFTFEKPKPIILPSFKI